MSAHLRPTAPIRSSALGLALVALVLTSPGAAQDGDIDGTISRPVVQALPSRASYELNAALTRLAANPRDVNALIDAGNAAMALGDSEAAMGFLGRADQLSPGNPRVKATLASAMVRNENPYDAIPLFDAAERAGASDAMLAGDRGLAYDLVGDNPSAQRFYRQALAAAPTGEPRDEIARRLALSLAIEGDRKGFEAALLPQLKPGNTAAWRTRAFGLAILGEEAEAVKIANGTMTRDLAEAMAPYLRYMIRLTPAQQAAAASFGHFPRAAQVGRDDPRAAAFASAAPRRPRTADAGLIPNGKPLGGKSASAKADTSKASRKRKRDTQVAAAAPTPRPAFAPARPALGPTPTPTPAPRPAAPTVRIAAATPPPAVFTPPTIFTPAASPTPVPSPKPVPQPSLTLTPAPIARPAPAPNPTPIPSSPVRVAVVPPPLVVATPGPAPAPTPSSGPTTSLTPASPPPPASGPSPVTPAPSNFDLAVLAQKSAATAPPPVAAVPRPASSRPRLADAFSDFRPPEDERRNAVAAVDIGKIVPAKPKSAEAKAIEERGLLPGAPSGTRRSATVETQASAKAARSAGSEKARPSAPSHPSRIWIQLAAGRDKAALGFDWRKQTRASVDLFKTKKGWTTPWGQTNRLLVGPFESQAAANTFLKELKKKDADAFVWTSPAGQAVDALAAK